jgi:tRNA-dihydrouridine synthase B
VAMQLFGQDPDVMRGAAARVAEAGADLIDLNMGCPVPKVCKTGAGAALLKDPDTAVAVARAAAEGSGLPVTVKLRAEGFHVARRLVEEAGVAGITFHPRTVKVRHKGRPDYDLAAELVQTLPVPVIVSGGMREADHIRWAFEYTGAEAIMLARGGLGNPWLFARLLGAREAEPTRDEVLAELDWVISAAEDHLGVDRASRYLRKFYPWYADRLGLTRRERHALVTAPTTADARNVFAALVEPALPHAA